MKGRVFRLHPSAFILPLAGDEEQVYRDYRRMTCRDTTARTVSTPGDTLKPFHKPAEQSAAQKRR